MINNKKLKTMGGNIKKLEATEQDILALARMHLHEKLSLKHLAAQMGRSVGWCTKTLQENGLYVGADGSDEDRIKKWNNGAPIAKRIEPFFKEKVKYIAVCNATGNEFKDFSNSSGALTDHLRKLGIQAADDTDFMKQKFMLEHGRPWYSDYFTFNIFEAKKKEERIYVHRERTEITEDQFATIKKAYLEDDLTIKETGKVSGLGESVVSRVLQEWGLLVPLPPYEPGSSKRQIDEHKRLKQEKLKENIAFENKKPKSIFEEGKKYFAVCKITDQKFEDFTNSSGALIRHIKEQFPGVEIPTGYKKRRHEKETGLPWHAKYFYFIENNDVPPPTKKCPYCEWTTVDLTNASGQYTFHLEQKHGKNVQQHLVEHPSESNLFQTEVVRIERRELIKSDPNFAIACQICGEKMLKITDTHVAKHGITLAEYKDRYSPFTLSEHSKKNFQELWKKGLGAYEHTFTSNGQKEVAAFIESLGFEVKMNDKKILKGMELDIVVIGKNLAIEYNGLFYHSDLGGKKHKRFHLDKTLACEALDMHLIHIFDDEWIKRSNIIKSKIAHILGASMNKPLVHARKCDIRTISISEANMFMEQNHIQGQMVGGAKSYAAFDGDSMIAVMMFDNRRAMTTNTDESVYELCRFATKTDIRCAGIGQRLLNHFIRENNPSRIVSFADRCYSNVKNNVYEKLGFTLEEVLPPDYKYLNLKKFRNERLHRFNYGKSSIAKKFPEIYHPDKEEWPMMQEAGFDRIWDCGKFRYVMTLPVAMNIKQ